VHKSAGLSVKINFPVFSKDSKKILWHVEKLLDNDRKISKYTTGITNSFTSKHVPTATVEIQQ
jgi:hypothetical protein